MKLIVFTFNGANSNGQGVANTENVLVRNEQAPTNAEGLQNLISFCTDQATKKYGLTSCSVAVTNIVDLGDDESLPDNLKQQAETGATEGDGDAE